jgi:membrane fusion protein, multidrug efflux system
MRMRWSLLIGLVVAAAAAAGAAAWYLRPQSVTVMHPAYGMAVQAVYATGTVEPVVMMPIAPRIGARLVSLAVDEGDVVKKGQVLAQLENEDLRNAIAQLAAQEEFARRDYIRYAVMVKEGVIARQTYDRAKSAYDAARAATATARAQIGYMTLTAPNNGRIIKRDGEVGQFLPVNQPLFWLSCLSPLRISAEVDEEDISLVRAGQTVLIRADAFPGRVFKGEVQAITPKGDPVARSYRVRITFDQTSPLQIGMTAENNIITREKPNALLVPSSAVAGGVVWLVEKGRLVKRAVKTGIIGHDRIEILQGLAPGDAVVINPDPSFSEGARVAVGAK